MAAQGKRKPVSIVRRFPDPPPVALSERKLVVVANTEQKRRYESHKLYDRNTVVIMTARDIQLTGAFGFELTGVDWKPGWALECEKPEIVVTRVNRRLEAAGRRLAI